jgi:hypothetical protein
MAQFFSSEDFLDLSLFFFTLNLTVCHILSQRARLSKE